MSTAFCAIADCYINNPHTHQTASELDWREMGDDILKSSISRRDYFAGLAMQNLQNVLMRKSGKEQLEHFQNELGTDVCTTIAKLAIIQADALILELDRKGSSIAELEKKES